MSSIAATFSASVKSVGTACTMALVGVYLHQRGFVDSSGKRTLAVISQQVTFPLFLFTKIIYCEQDWSTEPCPDVMATLRHSWILLVWPVFVVTAGLIVGQIVAQLTGTPMVQRKSVWAAVAFGNSTGLPITLLAVLYKKFQGTSVFGSIDPTMFLSVYLLLYPALQWGIGGWLLAPEEKRKEDSVKHDKDALAVVADVEGGQERRHYESVGESFTKNVLNSPNSRDYFGNRKLCSNDEGIYQSETNLAQSYQDVVSVDTSLASVAEAEEAVGLDLANDGETEDKPLLPTGQHLQLSYQNTQDKKPPEISIEPPEDAQSCRAGNLMSTLKNISDRCLQPPVVGALLGLIVAMVPPVRGVFVDIIDRRAHAPLEFIFDGLYSVGKAAVPINMLILGCNLSSSYNQYSGKNVFFTKPGLFSKKTMAGILLGKMIVMPIVGILSAIILRLFVLNIPEEMTTSFYLVLMIVFLTPTANNVMVMVELSGSDAKEGIASVIALQYAAAPVILSLTMSAAMGVAASM